MGKASCVAVLTTRQRNRLPRSTFAIPESREYPIEDKRHARNALARVSAYGSSSEKARVRGAVHRKYPGIGKTTARRRRGYVHIVVPDERRSRKR